MLRGSRPQVTKSSTTKEKSPMNTEISKLVLKYVNIDKKEMTEVKQRNLKVIKYMSSISDSMSQGLKEMNNEVLNSKKLLDAQLINVELKLTIGYL